MTGPQRLARVVLALGFAAILSGSARAAPDRPNVVFVLADDLGYGDPGIYHRLTRGSEPVIPTPNLDRLAREGMVFTRAYAPAAVCAPTRYSVVTGNNPYRGTQRWGTWRFDLPPQIPDEQRTVGEVLKAAGYHTAFIGKRHWGGNWHDKETGEIYRGHDFTRIDFTRKEEKGPTERGFDYAFVTPSGVQHQPYAFFENDRYWRIDGSTDMRMVWLSRGIKDHGEVLTGGWGDPDWNSSRVGPLLAEKAVEFIAAHDERNQREGTEIPFALFYASQAIHPPHTPPVEIAKGIPIAGVTGLGNKADMIYEFDQQVGMIVTSLEERGLLDDTLFIVTSDNGGLPPSQEEQDAGHDSYGGLRGRKGHIWEAGVRVPFIARWGDGTASGSVVRPGSVSRQDIVISDWIAAIYALTGQPMPPDQAMDSSNLLPVLREEHDPNLPLHAFFLFQSRKPRRRNPDRDAFLAYGVRLGNYVLALDFGEQKPVELYDLAADPRQETNRIDDPGQQSRVAQMLALHRRFSHARSDRTSPLENTAGSWASDLLIGIEAERSVDLGADLEVDLVKPAGRTLRSDSAPGSAVIPRGARVSSYILRFEPPSAHPQPATFSTTFDRPILAISYSADKLAASDALFEAAGSRGGRGTLDDPSDRISISGDGRSIDIQMANPGGGAAADRLRVFLAASGDFDTDGLVTARDVERLRVAIEQKSSSPLFDLDRNGFVERADVDFLLHAGAAGGPSRRGPGSFWWLAAVLPAIALGLWLARRR